MGSISHKHRSRLRQLALLVTATVWVGCGGDSNDNSAPTPTPQPTLTATAVPTATRTPVLTSTVPSGSPTPVKPQAGAGLASSITDVSIDSTGLIIATFTLTDAAGVPITPVLGATTDEQQARVRLVIAHVEDYPVGSADFTRYVNDINATHPAYDSKGTLQTVDAVKGIYQYLFGTHLPAGFNQSLTYTVGMQIDRFYNGVRLGVNPVFDLVPAGGTPEIWEDTTTTQCNQCHDPLIAHGNRREVRLCKLCHTEAATDNPPAPTPARSIDFRVMVHKIHMGKDLPLIVNGPPGSNYTIGDTTFAQKDANGVVTGVGYPRAIRGCTVCHAQAPTASYYMERPAASPCTSCHEDVNPSKVDSPAGPPGTNHVANRGFADSDCHLCHIADSGEEFDVSVVGAHVIPEYSDQLQGLNVTITNVANHAAGQTPVISFKVTDNTGQSLTASAVAQLNRLGFALSGPTSDYTVMLTSTAVGGGSAGTLTGPDANGIFQYTPTISIPANATGSWSIGAEARREVPLTVLGISPRVAEEASPNPVVTFPVDNSSTVLRRVVVDNSHCGACHGTFSKDFSVHGNLRNQLTYCVICHNPNQTDAARRKLDPAAVAIGAQTATVDFKRMIHKIHTGDQLENKPYLIYGFGPPPQNYSIIDFSDVRFPGDRRNCAKCHVGSSYLIPPYPGTALGTLVTHLDPATGNQVEEGRLGPIQSVCTACHDGEDAVAHAQTNTAADGVEACPVCHEEGETFAVSVVHAR